MSVAPREPIASTRRAHRARPDHQTQPRRRATDLPHEVRTQRAFECRCESGAAPTRIQRAALLLGRTQPTPPRCGLGCLPGGSGSCRSLCNGASSAKHESSSSASSFLSLMARAVGGRQPAAPKPEQLPISRQSSQRGSSAAADAETSAAGARGEAVDDVGRRVRGTCLASHGAANLAHRTVEVGG